MKFIHERLGVVIVEIVNVTRATLYEAEDFKQILLQDIELGWRKIIVDLSLCEFVDSTFLGTLVVSLKKITGHGGKIKLVGFQSKVNSMFQITGLDHVFESYPTKEEAIKSFK